LAQAKQLDMLFERQETPFDPSDISMTEVVS
jgi:hypothetical protein